MAQAREHQVAIRAPATFGLRTGGKTQGEAAATTEFNVARIVVDMEWLAVAALEQAVHAQPVQQGALRAAGIVLGRRRCTYQQVAATVDPVQQRAGNGRRQFAAVLQQHHRIVRPQCHLLQFQPWPRVHVNAIGAQGLAEYVQRVVGGFALWRQPDRLGHPFVRAQVEDGQRYAEQHQCTEQQRPEQARTHACHPYCWRRVSANASKSARLGRRPP